MNLTRVEPIVNAVLYEGYMLYPYRASSVKNRQRWTFGGIYPRAWAAIDESSASSMQTECLLRGDPETEVELHVRFLHLVRRDVGELSEALTELPANEVMDYTPVASLSVGEQVFQAWDEAIERDVTASALAIARLAGEGARIPFSFAREQVLEPLRGRDGTIVGILIRTIAGLEGEIAVTAIEIASGIYRLTVRIDNFTHVEAAHPDTASEAQRHAFASTHTVLGVRGGAFLSLLDPPDTLQDAASACRNQGTWPVLVGEQGADDMLLSSPIILYDYPQVAPESPGDLFDATEIDEILTLRILAMTDDEKREMAAIDPRARALLERTEALTAADMERLHGTLRNPHFGTTHPPVAKPELAFLHAAGRDLKVGDRVRLRPKEGGDIMDIVLRGEFAVIEAIERDFENKVHVAVVVDADPGREFGMERMPGHRFFFAPEELEPLGNEGAS